MVSTVHLSFKTISDTAVELRYFAQNPNLSETRSLSLASISHILSQAERDYYVQLPEDYLFTGRQLYEWLDGSERSLTRHLELQTGTILLAISTGERLAHVPWEILANSQGFLIDRGIIPVRWVSEAQSPIQTIDQPKDEALKLLFMATSPQDVRPELNYEAEESRILDATERQPLSLVVEESGCLSELALLLGYYGDRYFDVFHLTGHATIRKERNADGSETTIPCFITETDIGTAHYATAQDLIQTFGAQFPRLLFLSGCRTGQAGGAGQVASLAQALVQRGAMAVLGWGQSVLDHDATIAAQALYQNLAIGRSIVESLRLTYEGLRQQQARDWHLLRLYVGRTLPGALVTPPRNRRAQPRLRPAEAEFLDPGKNVKVAGRNFVGRRRQLQQCLRALKNPDLIGVWVHGMGGIGKSSVAARLCNRLPDYKCVVWIGAIDEVRLINKLVQTIDDPQLQMILQGTNELKFRLKQVFKQLGDLLLLVFDDFEALDQNSESLNLERGLSEYRLLPDVAKVMEALTWAIWESGVEHRVIVTCRYDVAGDSLRRLMRQQLSSMHGAELRKKREQLEFVQRIEKELLKSAQEGSLDDRVLAQMQDLQARSQQLADGNPRLMQWLDLVLCESQELSEAVLERLAEKTAEFREAVLTETLLEFISAETRRVLATGLVFEVPVPQGVFEVVCGTAGIDQAVALGLLEMNSDGRLRVPRILEPNLLELSELPHSLAARELCRVWWEEAASARENQLIEIHRLALLGNEKEIAVKIAHLLASRWTDLSRFREVSQLCRKTLLLKEDARILNSLAMAEDTLGEMDACLAHYRRALELCPSDEKSSKANLIHNLANALGKQGQVDEALILYQQSLELSEQSGDARGKAASLHDIATIYASQGQVDEALMLYQQSLELSEQSGNVRGKAATLQQVADIYEDRGQIKQALALYWYALDLDEQIGNVQGKAIILHKLAAIYGNQGQIKQALALYQHALNLHEQIGSIGGQAATLQLMAGIYSNQGKIELAMSLYQQSLELFERTDNVEGKATTLHLIANIYAIQGENELAIFLYKQSLELKEQIRDIKGKAASLHRIANIYAKQGQIEQAMELYQQSLELKDQIGDLRGIAATLCEIARIRSDQEQVDQAFALYQQALKLFEQIGNAQGKGIILVELAQLLIEKGDLKLAIIRLLEAIKIFRCIDSSDLAPASRILNRVIGQMLQSVDGQQRLQQIFNLDQAQLQQWVQLHNAENA